LMALLPPEAREELRRRLAEAPAAENPPFSKGGSSDVEPAATEAMSASDPAAPQIAEAIPETMETSAPAPAATATEPIPGDGIPKLIRRRSRRAPCNTLRPFDENGDGKISSADRYWRYVYIWSDRNGDRQPQDREVASAYDRKVREISVSLETFIRVKGGLGAIRVGDLIVLDLRGDGFSERGGGDDGILVVDAGALGRGNGPRLLGAGGEPLDGFVPFRSGLRLELASGVTELNCP
ncbi:MAG: hypothetical protein GY708_10885, partial [Actinomycetia bacterium]|nr:hypothetical protein [Actinomycetes bacterium]